MSHEIVITSAPEGLFPGSLGYSAVACTDKTPKLLRVALEDLSNYKRFFKAGDPNVKLNPVNFSHLILSLDGRTYHVLSRISDVQGAEYSGRENKLAHLISLDSGEMDPAGPARMLASEGFWFTQWDEKPRWLPQGRRPTADNSAPGAHDAWRSATGDAGWGAVLAQSVLSTGNQPMYVIFPPGTNPLPLALEALDLIPPDRRWNVSFSTYFSKLPGNVQCHWRFLLEGSEEAAAAIRSARSAAGNLIHISPSMGSAPDSELAQAVRDGRWLEANRPFAPAPAPVAKQSITRPRKPAKQDDAPSEAPTATEQIRTIPIFDEEIGGHRKRGYKGFVPLGAVITIVVVIASGVIWHVLSKPVGLAAKGRTITADAETRGVGNAAGQTAVSRATAAKKDELTELLNKIPVKSDEKLPEQPKQVASATQARVKPVGKPTPVDTPPAEKPLSTEEAKEAFKDILRRNRLLELPERVAVGNLVFLTSKPQESEPQEDRLATIGVRKSSDCELAFGNGAAVTQDKQREAFTLQVHDDTANNIRTWVVKRKFTNSIRQSTESPIGEFALDAQRLRFKWADNIDVQAHANDLRFVPLVVKVGIEEEICTLFKPAEMDAIVPAYHIGERIELPIKRGSVTDPKEVRIDLSLNIPGSDRVTLTNLKPNENGTLSIPLEVSSVKGQVDLDVVLSAKDGSPMELKLNTSIQKPIFILTPKELDNSRTPSEKQLAEFDFELSPPKMTPVENKRTFFADLSKDWERLHKNLDQMPSTLDDYLRELSRSIKTKEASDGPQLNPEEKKELQDELKNLRQRERSLRNVERKLGDAIKDANNAIQWCNDMDKLIATLRKESHLEVTILLETGKARIPILTTKTTNGGGAPNPHDQNSSQTARKK